MKIIFKMKKVLLVLVLGSLLATLVLPAAALAQEPPVDIPGGCLITHDIDDCPFGQCNVPPEGNCPGICCLLNTIYTATSWFFYILIVLSTIIIIWGGFSILFAAGDPEKMKKGRGTIIYALIGIAIALFARVIPSIVQFMMGV